MKPIVAARAGLAALLAAGMLGVALLWGGKRPRQRPEQDRGEPRGLSQSASGASKTSGKSAPSAPSLAPEPSVTPVASGMHSVAAVQERITATALAEGRSARAVWAEQERRTAQRLAEADRHRPPPLHPATALHGTAAKLEFAGTVLLVTAIVVFAGKWLMGDPGLSGPIVPAIIGVMLALAATGVFVPTLRAPVRQLLGAIAGVIAAVIISAAFSATTAWDRIIPGLAAVVVMAGSAWLSMMLLELAHARRAQLVAALREEHAIVIAARPSRDREAEGHRVLTFPWVLRYDAK